MTAQGLVIGLGAHFVRDLAEPEIGMPLLWPIDNRAFSIPRRLYRAALAVGVGRGLMAPSANRLDAPSSPSGLRHSG